MSRSPCVAVSDPALLIERDAVRAKQSDDGVAVVQLKARVARIAAGESALIKKHGNFFGLRVPLVDDVGRNVAENQVARPAGMYPGRPFEEAHAVGQLFDFGIGRNERVQARDRGE